jgi:endonuclease-3
MSAMTDGDADSARRIGEALDLAHPEAGCGLLARDPWELLVAAILADGAHEVQVNKVMAVLTERCCGPAAFAALDQRDLERPLRRLPLGRPKARAIVEAARAVLRLHGGKVPDTLASLAAVPGVGRRVAAVVVGHAFGRPAVVADRLVQRVVHRLGWTECVHPGQTDAAIAARFRPERWVRLCHQFVHLARDCCRRVAPRCQRCPLTAWCAKRGVA